VIVECSVSSLTNVGLPRTLFTPEDKFTRIGISLQPTSTGSLNDFPTYAAMLQSFELMIVPGGMHSTDCLFVSCTRDRGLLATNLARAVEEVGRLADYVGIIAGERYESLERRGQGFRPERFL